MRNILVCIVILAAALGGVVARAKERQREEPSAAALYDRFCLACHGSYGDGKGPAAPWLWPRPRDFTRGEYKWRSTPSGAPPTDDDLAAVIRHGVPGTSMHAFAATLGKAEIQGLVAYIKAFAPEAFSANTPELVPVPAPPPITTELAARGKEVYASLGCVACHGEALRGDGMAAASLRTSEGHPARPYDLTSVPLRRPGPAPGVTDIYRSIVTGLSGTPMPSYMGAAPDADLWAVAAYIDSIRYRPGPGALRRDPTAVDPIAIEIDRTERLTEAGRWPGNGPDHEAAVFGKAVALQGPAPAGLAPAQASVNALQCARCHAKQVREWTGSVHQGAGSPGLVVQILRMLRDTRKGYNAGQEIESCLACHGPLAEQQPVLRPGRAGGDDRSTAYQKNPFFDAGLQTQGVSCAGCHVRKWQRLGPPLLPGSGLLGLAGYPLTESPIYERSDLCLGCHQLPPRIAVSGRPLLNTYREWLEGPYMRRGVQCQHCHMPNREHTFTGVHDPDTFRQGIEVKAIAARSRRGTGAVSVRAAVTNVGAGHYLPTTPTPAAWLGIELIDGKGKRIRGAHAEKRIGRHIKYDKRFIELEDTRIPPGQSIELAAAWKDGDVARATAARIVVRVAPDDYYEGLYRARLRLDLRPDERAMFEQALRRAEGSHYVAVETIVPIE